MPKQKRKKWMALLLTFICCLPLAGCYDATEIDEEVYALVIGVDEGVNNMIRITFQYAAYKEGGGSGGGGGGGSAGASQEYGEVEGTVVSTVEASSLLEAVNILNAAVNRQIALNHAKMLVFSEDYAVEGVARYVEPLVRFREVREFMRIVVCKGKAEDFIMENRTLFGTNSSKAVELMFEQSKKTGYFPDIIFNDFYADLLTPYGQPTAIYAGVNNFEDLPLPEPDEEQPPLKTQDSLDPGSIPRKGGTKKELFGTAVFDGDKMVGTLDQNETRFFLMGIGEFKRGFFTLEDPNQPEYIYVIEAHLDQKPQVQVRFEKDIPIVDLKVILDVYIISIQSRKHYEQLGQVDGLEEIIQNFMQQQIQKTIEKTQKEWNADIFHFGRKAAGSFRTIEELNSYNWINHYQDAKVNTEVKVNIRGSGFIYGASPIQSTTSVRGESD